MDTKTNGTDMARKGRAGKKYLGPIENPPHHILDEALKRKYSNAIVKLTNHSARYLKLFHHIT